MAVINEIIKSESDDGLSFGDYLSLDKKKFNDFELAGDLYNIRTHNKVTRLEKNGSLLLETVPGSTVHNLKVSEELVTFSIEGYENTQITLEMESGTQYKISIGGEEVGVTKSGYSGKINFSMELDSNIKDVAIEKLT